MVTDTDLVGAKASTVERRCPTPPLQHNANRRTLCRKPISEANYTVRLPQSETLVLLLQLDFVWEEAADVQRLYRIGEARRHQHGQQPSTSACNKHGRWDVDLRRIKRNHWREIASKRIHRCANPLDRAGHDAVLFQALRWRTKYTFGGMPSRNSTYLFAGIVRSLHTSVCGSRGWICGTSQMTAI